MTRYLSYTTAGLLLILPLTLDATGDRLYIMLTSVAIALMADPAAAVAGRAWNLGRGKPHFVEGKSFAGSIAFALTALIVAGLSLTLSSSFLTIGFDHKWIWHVAAIIAICVAAVEALGKRGWDNLLIVLACTGLLLQLHGNNEEVRLFGLYALIAIGFGVGAYAVRFLDASGALAAGLLALSVFVFAGPVWAAAPLTFFLLSSVLSSVSARIRSTTHSPKQERGRHRDAVQVLANGGVGWIILIVFAIWPDPRLIWVYTASFAAAAADTWATEIGTAVRGRTVSIIGAGEVEPGVSGGISVAGLTASMLGAVSVLVAAMLVQGASSAQELVSTLKVVSDMTAVIAVIGGGILGSVADSLLGATLQGVYRGEDGVETESRGGPRRPNRLIRGLHWVNNDVVNAFCTLVGAIFAILILYS